MRAFEQAMTKSEDSFQLAYNLLSPLMQQVEQSISVTFQSTVKLIPEVSRHLIGSGGKRIRPLLLFLCGKAARCAPEKGLDLAVASELLHNATLLHDDVVDRGELRRGVPSAPSVYGNSASVLVGDFLLSKALSLVVSHGNLDLLSEFSRMLAEMAEGEVLQLIRSGHLSVSPTEYVEIISGKTAGLFSWCCRAGACLDQVGRLSEQAAQFGKAFGMAFQVTDDVLDYTSGPERSGKDLASDLMQGKATLPLLLATRENEKLRLLVEQVAASGNPNPSICKQIVQMVVAGGSIEQSILQAKRYVLLAKDQLREFPRSEATSVLGDLAESILGRI